MWHSGRCDLSTILAIVVTALVLIVSLLLLQYYCNYDCSSEATTTTVLQLLQLLPVQQIVYPQQFRRSLLAHRFRD